MLYQIVCLSCGYHRAWPTPLDAQADGHRHDAAHMTPCAPGPPTRDVARETGSGQSA